MRRTSPKQTGWYQLRARLLLIGSVLVVATGLPLASWAAGLRGITSLITTDSFKPTVSPDKLRNPGRKVSSHTNGNVTREAARQENGRLAAFSLQQKITQALGDGFADDQFGVSVAISGDTAVVGAYQANVGGNADQGAAYVFTRSGSSWSQQQKLLASDGAAGDGFGVSVAVAGDTLIVGAYAADAGPEPEDADRGAAYVFTRSGSVWTEQQKLLPGDGLGGDIFGFAVALNADTALIGAPHNDAAGPDAGAGYVFTRSGLTWTQQQKLVADDANEDDILGVAVALQADTAVLGALRHDVGTHNNQGSAYVFTRTGLTWSQQQQLIASDGTANDQFGVSVGLSGDSIIVGANFKDNGVSLGQGAAYIFTGSGGLWTEQQKLLAADGATSDAFGTSVAISGATVVIGSSDNDIATADQGSVYTFTRGGAIWTQEQNLTSADGVASDFLGSYVAIDGNTFIAGAPLANVGSNSDQGAAYIFNGQLSTLTINDVTITEGNSGTSTANFTVSLTPASADTVTVQFATADGTARAGSDYVTATGTLTFTPGQLTQPISITVNGDTLTEPNETFFVNLSNATNAVIGDNQGQGTIQNNDAGATLPANFVETEVTGLSNPTAMALAPDGRIFVCEQAGNLRVIDNGVLLSTSFLTVTVNSSGERGLLGVAFDPDFANNHFVYVYYTATLPTIHNRVSRFTANGNVAVPGSETILLELNTLGATNHNGGAIHFGPDGKLYIAVGENAVAANAQSFNNLLGKILRINPNPQDLIPTDNPYFQDPNVIGNNKAIWALGLRNPFTFDFQQGTNRMFINDVGETTWEEINEGVAHSNYGWNRCEGQPCSGGPPVDYRAPIYTYGHSGIPPTGCAIVGGAFYNPTTMQFPASFFGKYFFADLCSGFIRYVDPTTTPPIPASTGFATNINMPVDLKVGNDGSLYYLARGRNSVFRIQYVGAPTFSISGRVTYLDSNSGAGNVIMTLSGSQSATTITDANGLYSFSGLPGGSYTVTPSKTGDINGITAFDASLTARNAAGLETLTLNQLLAADASNAGGVTAFDASLIARTAAGIPNSGFAGTWKLVPSNRDFMNLTSNQTNQNFIAVLVGDVSGNWQPGAPKGLRALSREATIPITLPAANDRPGALSIIPITVKNLTAGKVFAYEFDVAFDPNVLQPQEPAFDASETLSSRCSVTVNTQVSGQVSGTVFSTQPLAEQGTLLKLRFKVVGAVGSQTPLTWKVLQRPGNPRFLFNEGDRTTSPVDGYFTVLPQKTAPSIQKLEPLSRRQYPYSVNREADQGGLDYWTQVVQSLMLVRPSFPIDL